MSDNAARSPEDRVREFSEQAESNAAKAFEQLVGKPSFGVLMARSAENVAAVTRIGSDIADLVLRNLRVAGRADITRIAHQLHRTEDKLERVLQEVEDLRGGLAAEPHPAPAPEEAGRTPGVSNARRNGQRKTATRRGAPAGPRVRGR